MHDSRSSGTAGRPPGSQLELRHSRLFYWCPVCRALKEHVFDRSFEFTEEGEHLELSFWRCTSCNEEDYLLEGTKVM